MTVKTWGPAVSCGPPFPISEAAGSVHCAILRLRLNLLFSGIDIDAHSGAALIRQDGQLVEPDVNLAGAHAQETAEIKDDLHNDTFVVNNQIINGALLMAWMPSPDGIATCPTFREAVEKTALLCRSDCPMPNLPFTISGAV